MYAGNNTCHVMEPAAASCADSPSRIASATLVQALPSAYLRLGPESEIPEGLALGIEVTVQVAARAQDGGRARVTASSDLR